MNSLQYINRELYAPKDEELQARWNEEKQEAAEFLQRYEAAIEKAAGFLNREFPQVPTSTWKNALENPDMVQFTDEKKEARFEGAQEWIGTQC